MVTPAAVPQAIVSITRRIKIFGIVRSATVVAAVGVPAQQRLYEDLWHGRRARDVSAITIRLTASTIASRHGVGSARAEGTRGQPCRAKPISAADIGQSKRRERTPGLQGGARSSSPRQRRSGPWPQAPR